MNMTDLVTDDELKELVELEMQVLLDAYATEDFLEALGCPPVNEHIRLEDLMVDI